MKKLRIKVNIPTVIIFLASVFFITKVIRTFSGVVGESGGIWNFIQAGFVAAGLLWAFKFYPLYRDNSPVVIMVLLNIYMFIRAFPKMNITFAGMYNYLMILYSMSILVLFFVIGRRIDMKERTLLYFTFYIITIIVIGTMIRFLSGGARRTFIKLIDVADVYYSLGLMPLAYMYINRKYQFIPILLTALALIFSEKRAGVLALVGMVLALYLINSSKDNLKDSFRKIILLMVAVFSMYYMARYVDSRFNIGFFYRLLSMGEDGGSGRLDRWRYVLDAIKSAGILKNIFGHGWGSIYNILNGHAHNDFLELYYEFGIIAPFLYGWFFLSLIAKLTEMVKFHYKYANIFAASIVCSLFISMFSYYIIKPTYITCGMICFGLFLSDFKKYKTQSP